MTKFTGMFVGLCSGVCFGMGIMVFIASKGAVADCLLGMIASVAGIGLGALAYFILRVDRGEVDG